MSGANADDGWSDVQGGFRLDGSRKKDTWTYPQRLAGFAIPLAARVFSIADTLDALTSDRCYRPGRGLPAARVEIHRAAGSQFDPAIIELFDRVADREFETVRKQFPDNP